jgi:hypothetical protein
MFRTAQGSSDRGGGFVRDVVNIESICDFIVTSSIILTRCTSYCTVTLQSAGYLENCAEQKENKSMSLAQVITYAGSNATDDFPHE